MSQTNYAASFLHHGSQWCKCEKEPRNAPKNTCFIVNRKLEEKMMATMGKMLALITIHIHLLHKGSFATWASIPTGGINMSAAHLCMTATAGILYLWMVWHVLYMRSQVWNDYHVPGFLYLWLLLCSLWLTCYKYHVGIDLCYKDNILIRTQWDWFLAVVYKLLTEVYRTKLHQTTWVEALEKSYWVLPYAAKYLL